VYWIKSLLPMLKNFARCASAVSYTHLDVYKRQELHRAITAKDLIHGHVLLRKGKKNYVSVTAK